MKIIYSEVLYFCHSCNWHAIQCPIVLDIVMFFCWECASILQSALHHVRPCSAQIPVVKAKTPSEFWSVSVTNEIYISSDILKWISMFWLMFVYAYACSIEENYFYTYAHKRLLVVRNLKILSYNETHIRFLLLNFRFTHCLNICLLFP